MIQRAFTRVVRTSPFKLGIYVLVATTLVTGLLFQKSRIVTAIRPGETIRVDFTTKHWLRPNVTEVKIAGVPVGVVSGLDESGNGGTAVSVKLRGGTTEKLGSSPSAAIRPTTLLGGSYYIELRPGGDPGRFRGAIPVDRTTTPVELDRVLEVLRPEARAGLQSSVRHLDATLDDDGRQALGQLLHDAPGALAPTGDVFDALRGTRPDQDLTQLVTGLESTARILTEKEGRLGAILSDLRTTTGVLDNQRGSLAAAVAELPGTLRTARGGLTALHGSLQKLEATAPAAIPTVRDLATLLEHADPVLAEARPMVADLRALLADARPAVQTLVPTSRRATAIFDDVRGPVLDRVNGPIMTTVLSPYRGTGQYAGSGDDKPFFQMLAYMFAGLDSASKLTDRNGAAVGLHVGVGPGSLGGTPINFEQLFANLLGGKEARR